MLSLNKHTEMKPLAHNFMLCFTGI